MQDDGGGGRVEAKYNEVQLMCVILFTVFWFLGKIYGVTIGSGVSEHQGVTKRCRLSLLTNSTLVLRVQMRGEGGSCGVSAIEYSCAHHMTWSPKKL
jgi:hypothetical protein